MKTEILKVDKKKPELKKISYAAGIIKEGGLVAFPTETVYGLGADALNATAVRKIFKAKKRPADDPIIVHVYSINQVQELSEKIPTNAKKLMEKFWPGPLTLILKKSKIVPKEVTSGLDTVAIRMPSHPIARALIKSAGKPIAAPSANLFGKPSPTKAEHVKDDLNGRIDVILDGGYTNIGVESTVLDLTSKIPTLLRPGGINLEDLKKVLGKVLVHPAAKAEKKKIEVMKSPGMMYRHYAPNADVILVEFGKNRNANIKGIIAEYRAKDIKVGVISTTKNKGNYGANIVKFLGNKPEKIAKKLFGTFRELDKMGAEIIVVEGIETSGLGLAVMNRLRKASCRIIKV